ncbi:MAG: SdpI family protein [Firmicutes bacterium]|nr:SdpI family protein [Bacillota bacterium]
MPEQYSVKKELRSEWYLLLILLLVFLISWVVYPSLPEKIATHWNVEGEVDGYSNRFTGVFFIPLLTLAFYLLFIFMPLIDPRRKNYPEFIKTYRLVKLAFVLFMTGLHLLTLAFNLGYDIDISRCVILLLGILFTLLGRGLPRIRHNYFIGIRTPWTLASPSVWTQTHQLGGKLFFWSGLAIIFGTLLPDRPRFWLMMVLVLGCTLVATVASYIYFRREENGEKE